MRNENLLEYVTSHHHPSDPDVRTQVVTADLLGEAVDYYVESLSSEDALELLSEYMYERMYDHATKNDPVGLVRDIVDGYIKDTI